MNHMQENIKDPSVELLVSKDREAMANLAFTHALMGLVVICTAEDPDLFKVKYLRNDGFHGFRESGSNVIPLRRNKIVEVLGIKEFGQCLSQGLMGSVLFFTDITPLLDAPDSLYKHLEWFCGLALKRRCKVLIEIEVRDDEEIDRLRKFFLSLNCLSGSWQEATATETISRWVISPTRFLPAKSGKNKNSINQRGELP